MTILVGPYRSGVLITKSDATVLPVTRGVYVGGTGNMNVRTAKGDTVLFSGIPAGTVLPIAVDQVLSTSTTATLMIALY